jgi:hypothetical protein
LAAWASHPEVEVVCIHPVGSIPVVGVECCLVVEVAAVFLLAGSMLLEAEVVAEDFPEEGSMPPVVAECFVCACRRQIALVG